MITEFRGKYEFLSNFYPCRLMLDNEEYPSVEHAYHAAKAYYEDCMPIKDADGNVTMVRTREFVKQAETPDEAKKRGRKVAIRSDWEGVKIGIMCDLLERKFEDVYLLSKLLRTGNEELVEGNWWGDTFWGVCKGKGENNLGKLLMGIRKNHSFEDVLPQI